MGSSMMGSGKKQGHWKETREVEPHKASPDQAGPCGPQQRVLVVVNAAGNLLR